MRYFTPYGPGPVGGINVRGGGHPATGKTRGQTFPIHFPVPDEDIEEPDLDSDELDDFVDKIASRTDARAVSKVDIGTRRDVGNFVTNVGGYITMENATTPVMQGISPRLSYRSKNTKGPAFGVQSRATYIRDKPGRISGTQYGTSRAPINLINTSEPIWSLSDLDPYDDAMSRHNRIKRFILSLEDV